MNAITELLSCLSEHAEHAEVFGVRGESTLVSFEANGIKSVEVEETDGLALRAVIGGRLGFTAATGRPDTQSLVDNLIASAQHGERVPIVFPGAAQAAALQTFDPTLAEVPESRLVEIGREIIAVLTDLDGDASVHADLVKGVERVTLQNTAGAEMEEDYSSFSVSVTIERVREGDILVLGEEHDSISLDDTYQEMVERLARHLRLARRSVRIRSGHMPVLFSPAGTGVLTLPVLLALDGRNVQQNASPLAGRVGELVFDEKLTLWDDPTIPTRTSSSRYDDEGVPCRRKALIERGTCGSYLLDLRTAALLGMPSTGNGAREIFTAPAPEPSCLVMKGGDTPVDDIVAKMGRGLLVEDVLGLGQGNEMSGAFSNTVGLAYLIEGGEIVGRVKDVSIAGNVYDLLRQVEAVSAETIWVDGNTRMPYILLPDMNVVAASSR
jgi:PmbA protein